MFEIINGEIEIKKDNSRKKIFILAFLLALVVFLLLLRVGAVTKFVEGSRIMYEGIITDRGMTSVPLISGNPFYEASDTRSYIGLLLENGDEICIYSASLSAPDHSSYDFPAGLNPGAHAAFTAAEEIGTGLMVVQDTIYYIDNHETADS